jgi:hypothetical protein
MVMRTSYPAPGAANSKAAGLTVVWAGTDELRARLGAIGPEVKTRIVRVLDVLGRELAVAANAAAPVGKRRHRRAGGGLARSFRVYARPQWEKYGTVGVAVRSATKYHYYQEFGVNRPDNQVVLHRDDKGKAVSKGRRYRDGTKKLRDGVRVSTYRRDIIIPATSFFGRVFQARRAQLAADLESAVSRYLERIAPKAPSAGGAA